jgi:alpha,alpha-trehalase
MKKETAFLVTCIFIAMSIFGQLPATPDKIYGKLFHDVQMSRIFTDGKFFVDCIPKKAPAEIVADYLRITSNPAVRFSLKLFVEQNFILPPAPQSNYVTPEKDIVAHIKNLWSVLRREPDKQQTEGSSLLPLPYPYIVPGGRFREVYYWDSYFTMLGLKESGENDMLENMVKNFAYLIDTFGHIPNGNRTYYLSRSQPPFFSLMIDLLASVKGDNTYLTYLPQLEKEYNYWMEGASTLQPGQAVKKLVKLKDGTLLNRYWDEEDIPRQESYYEDYSLTSGMTAAKAAAVHRNLRAAAASGWDFSGRWFADKKNINSIQTINIIPVDLNCLLYKLELVIARAKQLNNNDSIADQFRKNASIRLAAIDKYCWSKSISFYTDYNFVAGRQTNEITAAGIYPFCFFEEKLDFLSLLAKQSATVIKTKLLKDGGIAATENNTGQQWDAPNGWAPLQWMTIWGLDRCGQKELARDIAQRWIALNTDVFKRTGKLMEKYNVEDTKAEAGGGEYKGQDGFGWTNGVLLKLISLYGVSKN